MPVFEKSMRQAVFIGLSALLAGAVLSWTAFGQPTGIDPQAQKLLKVPFQGSSLA